MKAQVLTGLNQMELVEVPTPEIRKDDDVLLKIEIVGICGSDVHYYETGCIGSQVVQYPYMVGHECSAKVVEIGRAVTRVKVGDAIVVEPAVSCHQCDQCKIGRENTCRNLSFLGTPGQGDGCLCEYMVMPEEACLPITDKITLAQGALCEPFAIGVYSVKQGRMPHNDKIVILGSGPIGLSCMAAALAEGKEKIYMTDKIDERMVLAKNNGAVWTGNPDKSDIVSEILKQEQSGIDVVYECAGQQSTVDEALELLRPGGRLVLVGIPREPRISFAIEKLRRKEITVVNIRRQNDCTDEAIELVASGKAKIDFMITHRFDFLESKQGFDMVAGYNDGVVKAIIQL